MNRIVKAFRNNSGVRVPSIVLKPSSEGVGGGGGATALPGMERLVTKSEFQANRMNKVLDSLKQKQAVLKEKNAIVRELKKGNDLTKLAKAQNVAKLARADVAKTKRNIRDMKKGRISWGTK